MYAAEEAPIVSVIVSPAAEARANELYSIVHSMILSPDAVVPSGVPFDFLVVLKEIS